MADGQTGGERISPALTLPIPPQPIRHRRDPRFERQQPAAQMQRDLDAGRNDAELFHHERRDAQLLGLARIEEFGLEESFAAQAFEQRLVSADMDEHLADLDAALEHAGVVARVLARGTLTWPDSDRAAESHAASLVRFAEAALAPGCAPAILGCCSITDPGIGLVG